MVLRLARVAVAVWATVLPALALAQQAAARNPANITATAWAWACALIVVFLVLLRLLFGPKARGRLGHA